MKTVTAWLMGVLHTLTGLLVMGETVCAWLAWECLCGHAVCEWCSWPDPAPVWLYGDEWTAGLLADSGHGLVTMYIMGT